MKKGELLVQVAIKFQKSYYQTRQKNSRVQGSIFGVRIAQALDMAPRQPFLHSQIGPRLTVIK